MALLELHGISRQYKMGQVTIDALKPVDLTVEQGDFVSIMGPSGSGKSTLLNIIGCLDRPSTGQYSIAGKRVDQLGDSHLADTRNRFIGFVFQTFHLLPNFSACANVELPLIYRGVIGPQRRKKAVSALEAVGLGDRVNHLPSQLSGGEQQRVAIARALVGNPRVLLADEPSGALDSKSGQLIMAIFQQLNNEDGITIVQVTHDENISRHGRRVVRLLDGEIETEQTLQSPLVAEVPDTGARIPQEVMS